MPRRPPRLRKRRTREHIIADLSINYVERQVLLSGNTVERWQHDYGLDLVLWSFTDNGEPESGMVFFQVKATDNLNAVANGRFVTCRVDRRHLRSWLTEPMPVVLVVYDAADDRAYWLYVQSAFSGVDRFRAASGSATATLRIPVEQSLDPAAVRRFAGFSRAAMAQIPGVFHEQD